MKPVVFVLVRNIVGEYRSLVVEGVKSMPWSEWIIVELVISRRLVLKLVSRAVPP